MKKVVFIKYLCAKKKTRLVFGEVWQVASYPIIKLRSTAK